MSTNYLEEQFDQIRLARFHVGPTEYAVEIQYIQEILPPQDMREIPNMPGFVEGCFNLRGAVIPGLDLRKLFGEVLTKEETNRILIHHYRGSTLGFLVDSIEQVLNINKNEMQPAPLVLMRGRPQGCLSKVIFHEESSILLLDLTKIMPDEAKKQINTAAEAAS